MNARVAGVGCAFAAAVSAAAASAATPGPIPVNPGGPDMPAASASLDPASAGAKRAALTVKVHYEMVCGQPGLGTAILTLPAAITVPRRIDESAVLVNGTPTPHVSVAGHDVTVAMPPRRPGVTCMVMGPGTLTLALTRAAGLANPKSAGTYTVRVRRSARTFVARIHVSA